MHPAICSYVRELFYEGRLHARSELSRQRIDGNTKFKGSGLWLEPVEHEGNQSSSLEEVESVTSIIAELTSGSVKWINDKEVTKILSLNATGLGQLQFETNIPWVIGKSRETS